MRKLFILGAPGSGKGTVSKLLLESFTDPVRYYNVGGILREQADSDPHIKETHAQGGLVDSDRVLQIFDDALQQDSYLIDGSPRKAFEANFILNHPRWKEDPGWLIYLDVDASVAKGRLLKRGRFDDTLEIIDKRLESHFSETMKSVELFKKAGRSIQVRADHDPESVCSTILYALRTI